MPRPAKRSKRSSKPFLALITPITAPPTEPPTEPSQPDPGYDIPDTGLERPEHPIYYPLPPGAPVDPAYDIPETGVERPEHPIVLPPETEGGWGPIYVWGGGPGARPPIVVPPEATVPPEAGGKIEFKAVWTPTTGWFVIGIPTGLVPTPSNA